MARRTLVIAVALMAAAVGVQVRAAPAPIAGIASFTELKRPLPYPYDEQADADADIAHARAKAKAEHKLLLIDFGGNWCGDCRVLAGTIELPPVKAFVDRHYEMVSVDVGRFNRNLQAPAHYGFTQRLTGVPTLLVVDPATDTVINRGDVFALSDARSMSPQALADWLAKWVK